MLNTGYRKGGAVTVCVGQGANLDVRDFSTFCPKAIAGIGKLPDTVAAARSRSGSRSGSPSEPIERFRERKARSRRARRSRTGCDSVEPLLDELEHAEPELPEELSDRAQDVWEPLLAIADAAGGEWPKRARNAAVRLSAQRQPDEATLGIRLLSDIRDVFGDEGELTTTDLRRLLRELEESPWGGRNDGEGIRARELANKLRPYGIKSTTSRGD